MRKHSVKRCLCALLCIALLIPPVSGYASADDSYVILLGDMDMDNAVTTDDARLILRMSVGIEQLMFEEMLLSADLDLDGEVTTDDARHALRTSVSLESPKKYTVTVGELEKPTMGIFRFVSYGWGHGVGLSQEGAVAMAENGADYVTILTHYYTGITIKTESIPDGRRVRLGSTVYSLKEALARIADAELGPSHPAQARLAQIVAIYSGLKYKNKNKGSGEVWDCSSVAYISSSRSYSQITMQQVQSVYGKYAAYNGEAINAIFGAANAGRSAAAKTVWGSNSMPYLQAVDSPGDVLTDYYGSVYEISSADLRKAVREYSSKYELSRYPEEWLEVLEHDSAVSSGTGYVSTLRIGNRNVWGETLCLILGYSKLKSPCFYFTFIPADI